MLNIYVALSSFWQLAWNWKEGNAANRPEKRYNLTTNGSLKCCGILGIMPAKLHAILVKSCNFCNFALFKEDFLAINWQFWQFHCDCLVNEAFVLDLHDFFWVNLFCLQPWSCKTIVFFPGLAAKLELACKDGNLQMQLSASLGHPDNPHFPDPPFLYSQKKKSFSTTPSRALLGECCGKVW